MPLYHRLKGLDDSLGLGPFLRSISVILGIGQLASGLQSLHI